MTALSCETVTPFVLAAFPLITALPWEPVWSLNRNQHYSNYCTQGHEYNLVICNHWGHACLGRKHFLTEFLTKGRGSVCGT